VSGPLVNMKLQRAMKDEERRLREWEIADIGEVMGTQAGRRFVYRIIFEVGNLESSSWCPTIKDGVCSALHMAHLEGMREGGRVVMREIQRHYPEQWQVMLNERLAKEAADNIQRENIHQSAEVA